jgi:hypothetical protein
MNSLGRLQHGQIVLTKQCGISPKEIGKPVDFAELSPFARERQSLQKRLF